MASASGEARVALLDCLPPCRKAKLLENGYKSKDAARLCKHCRGLAAARVLIVGAFDFGAEAALKGADEALTAGNAAIGAAYVANARARLLLAWRG